MASYTTQDIRNLVLVGHGGSGKTSLAEALLNAGGAIPQIGLVEKGTTLADFTDEEKERGHSLYSAVMHCDFQGKHLNMIDTPGFADFAGQAFAALNAVESAFVVINASAGIEPNTRRMMMRTNRAGLCRFIVINKIDSGNLDLAVLIDQIKETFGSNCLPINLPAENGSKVIDCFANTEGESDLGAVADFHTAIVERVVEMDDELMETYLEEGEVPLDKLDKPFAEALRRGHLIPICFTSARTHDNASQSVGVRELLDVIVNLAPSPVTGNPRTFQPAEGDEIQADPDPAKPVIAHTFKVLIDRFGKLSMFRIHQGTVTKDTSLHVDDNRKPAKIAHVYAIQGAEHIEVNSGVPGDICAVIKVDDIHTNSVLHANGSALTLNAPPIPEPMFGLAITAKKRGEEQKIGDAISKIEDEDPGFKRVRNVNTGEMVIYGMGEQHLRVILEKMKIKFHVEVDTHPPKIAYQETIQITAEGHHKHKKQTGGAGQFGEVFLRVEPLERSSGFEFVNDIFGGSVPAQFLPAIEKGVRLAMAQGGLAGCAIQDIKVSVYDGKYHPVDSKEVAFVAAGKRAFLDAFLKAKPILLEPIVELEVTVPNANMGDITGDLSGKRGRIQGTDMLPDDMATIQANVPLSEVSNYQSQLKSVTGGRGSYTMELSHYEPVPPNEQQRIVAAHKPKKEED
jgi:elongation factor G